MKSLKSLIDLLRILQPLPGASFLILVLIPLCSIIPRNSKAEQLSIDPEIQSSPVWCWLAVGKMVFRHFDIENVNPLNYQCGIVGLGALGSANEACMIDWRIGNISWVFAMSDNRNSVKQRIRGESGPRGSRSSSL